MGSQLNSSVHPPDTSRREGVGGIKKYGCCYAKICHKMISKQGSALTQTRDMPRLMINLTLTTLYVSYCYWMKSNTKHEQMLRRKYVSQPSFSWKGNPKRWCKTPESKQTPWHLLSTSLLVSSGLKTKMILNYKWVLIYGPKFGKTNKKLAKNFKIIRCEVKSAKVVPLLQSNLR